MSGNTNMDTVDASVAENELTEPIQSVEPSICNEIHEESKKDQLLRGVRIAVQMVEYLLKNPKAILTCQEFRGVLSHIHSADSLRLYLERLLMESDLGALIGSVIQAPQSHVHEMFHLLLQSTWVETVVSLASHVISDANIYKLASRAIPLVLNELMPLVISSITEILENNIDGSKAQQQRKLADIQIKYVPKYEELLQKFVTLVQQVLAGEASGDVNEDDQAWLEVHTEIVTIVNKGREDDAGSCSTVKMLGGRIGQLETELRVLRGQYVRLATNDCHPSAKEWEDVIDQVDVLGDLMSDTSNDLEQAFADADDEEEDGVQECDEHCECHDDDDWAVESDKANV
jgi:hypothetical protein